MDNKYLPIGSVVILKGGKKRVMITGFCSIATGGDNTIYDYSGCLYPEGLLNSNEICLFNNEQIDKIFFKGLEDDEEKAFKDALYKNLDGSESNISISLDNSVVNNVEIPTFNINDSIFN